MKKKVKVSKKDKSSNVLSYLSLLIAVAGIIFASPLILEYYNRANLEVSSYYPQISGNKILSVFKVVNTGRSTATKLSIKFISLENDNVIINLTNADKYSIHTGNIHQYGENINLRDVIVEIERLPYRDSILCSIISIPEEFEVTNAYFKNSPYKNFVFPDLTSIAYDQGAAQIDKQRKKPIISPEGIGY